LIRFLTERQKNRRKIKFKIKNTNFMTDSTITFSNHNQILALFGAQDRNLKQIREAVGVDVVVRGDEIQLHGEDPQVQKGLDVFLELKALLDKKGQLKEEDVTRAIRQTVGLPDEKEELKAHSIDVFERAKKVHPKTPGQAEYVQTIAKNDLVFCFGPAGCGKTYLAVAMAINALRSERVRKIVLVRPAVEAGEKLGFLPGDMLAKVNPYLRPLLDALHDILDFEQVKRYMENDVIEIVPLAFMRGRTLNETFIILDEGQNTTITQMKMFLTRMGTDSKIVVTGDITQLDLPHQTPSGMTDAVRRLQNIDGVGVTELTGRDIVRHRLVREIVKAYDETNVRTSKVRKK
jgi:phosphate starvation-inducible PhoH-like protein